MDRTQTMKDVLAVVLAGGAGERLSPLTLNRAKPAVPFGGQYRLVDFTLSNCLNSECRRILVLVQYKHQSLTRHIRQGWNYFHPAMGEFIDVISAQKRVGEDWYQGTADAIYQNLYSIMPMHPREVMVLAGDHIYKMNYGQMIKFHRANDADLTVAAIEMPIEDAHRFGVLEVDFDARITGFQEKPKTPTPMPDRPDTAFASMGVYVFNMDTLEEACIADQRQRTSHDFGKDIIPQLIHSNRVFAYHFRDENRKEAQYWRDVGTIDAYWEANMDLVSVDPEFNLYDRHWPIRTLAPSGPPAKFVFAQEGARFGAAVDSIVSAGCILSGGMVNRCVLSPDVRINSYAKVEESILFRESQIGRHARVRRAIVEKNVAVPPHAVIGYDLDHDRDFFKVTDRGVVVVDSNESLQASMRVAPVSVG